MDDRALLLVELGAVVLVLGILARLAGRLAISPIPLYLIAGLMVGEGGLYPVVTSEEFIEVGAELGVIFLLLMLGLEYSAGELVSGVRSMAGAGLFDLILNFTPGFIAGLLLGWGPVLALFLGGVTYISSTGVIAKLLHDLGWTGNRETPVILSVLVFEDLAMALILPLLGALALGGTTTSAMLTIGVAFVGMTAALALAYRQGDRLGSFIFHRSDEVSLLSIFGLTLVVAGLAEGASISAAVGAFLVGISLSGEAVARAHSLIGPLRDLFAAVFFVFFGLSTDPGALPGVLGVAVVLGLVTASTKLLSGWYAARQAGLGKAGRRRTGLALMARGEFSIIIAGLAAGIAGAEELAALAAAYVLLMAVIGPIAAKFADPGRARRGRDQAATARASRQGNWQAATDTVASMTAFKQLINGQWVDAADGGTWDLVNPATEEVIESLPFGDARDATAAVDAAADAFHTWSHLTSYQRGKVLDQTAAYIESNLDDYAKVTTEESGKPFAQARAEWAGAPNQLRWAAGEAQRLYGRWIPSRVGSRRIDVTYQPMGVIGVITAWNFPVYNQMRAISSALAVGCTVVSRPSEYTPRSAMLIGQAFMEAGLPPGALNVINGEPEAMGQIMLNDKRVKKIQFTGSTRVGRLLMDGASKTVTRLSLELGGNAPVLVFPDAGDIAAVAQSAMTTKVRNNGQVCIAPQRFYVHDSVVDEFAEVAVATAEAQVLGNGLDPDTTVGPLINARQRDRVEELVSASVDLGAKVMTGGSRSDRSGYFYEPTVITNVTHEAPVHNEEIFGPVMPVIQFDDIDDVIARANATDYGLAAYVYTRDLATAFKVSEELEFGMIGINDWFPSTPEAPFGGMKQSGLGREAGSEGLLEYVEAKTRYFGGIG